jgi:adenylate cyclase
VEVQATLVAAGLTGLAISEAPRWLVMGLALLVLALSFLLVSEWRPMASLLLSLAIVLTLAGAALLLFSRHHLWLPVFAPMTAAGGAYIARGGIAYLAERQRRQQIKLAFAYYVSPDVVEEITNHPERLTLGGDRRELTLLFTDLAGFTSLSEQLGAEEIADVLNRHLTAMTHIIMRHQGTVGKFIGDAIMAFWNAPLTDPDHAVHACMAAREMQEEAARQRAELTREGLPPLMMRIGIHTGEAVVGNMGSEERFDYTAIGDTVNLASRLEGVNKLYGTGILLSAATADRARESVSVLPVDRVRVKGKTQAIDIFTIGEDGPFADAARAAIDAYRDRRWDEAEGLWQKAAELRPDASIPVVYLARIASFRSAPPPEDWDGSTSLEKL